MGYFCRKYVMFQLKKYRRSYVVKNDLRFQNLQKELSEFLHKQLKVMLDKCSVYSVLAEGMDFSDKSNPSNFNFLDFLLLV